MAQDLTVVFTNAFNARAHVSGAGGLSLSVRVQNQFLEITPS